MNVKFINLTALPAWDSAKATKWNGLFVYVTEGDDKGLYFGQDEWKKLSNVAQDTTAEIHSASIDEDGVVSFFNSTDGTGDALFTLTLAKVASTGSAADVTLAAYVNSEGSSIAEGTSVQDAIEAIIESIDQTNADAADAVEAEETRAKAAEKANADRLDVLEGDDTVDGSVDKKIKDAIGAVVDGAPEAFDTLKEIAAWIGSDETGTTELISRVGDLEDTADDHEERLKAVEDQLGGSDNVFDVIKAEEERATEAEENLADRLDVLEGDEEKTGSVAKAVKDAKDALLGDAAEDYNTLGKLEDKIQELDGAAYAGVENADDDQFVKVSAEDSDNKQTLSVTLGEFDTDENGNLTKDAAANGLKDDKDGLVKASEVGAIIVANEKVTAAALSDHEERLKAVEDQLGGSDNVYDLIDAVEGRLDVLEGADTVEGSVAKAVKDAKEAIEGTLAADDAATLEAVNDELDSLDERLGNLEATAHTTVAGDNTANSGVEVTVSEDGDSDAHEYKVSAELVWLTELPA